MSRRINLNRDAPLKQSSVPASGTEARKSAPALPVLAQEQPPGQYERHQAPVVAPKDVVTAAYHHESSRDVGTAYHPPSIRPPQTKTSRGAGLGVPQLRVPESVQQAQQHRREQEMAHQELGAPSMPLRLPKRPKKLHQRENALQPLLLPKLERLQQPQDHRLNSQGSHVHERSASGSLYESSMPVISQPQMDVRANSNPVREHSPSNSYLPQITSIPSVHRSETAMYPNSNPIRERNTSNNPYPPPAIVIEPRPQLQIPGLHSPHSPHSQRVHHMQQSHGPSQFQSHVTVLEHNMFGALITRLDRIAEKEDASREHQIALAQRLGIMENTLEDLRVFSLYGGNAKPRADELNVKGRNDQALEEAKKKADEERKQAEEEGKVILVDGQRRILHYLSLLAKRLGEIGRATAETQEVLGIINTGSLSAPIDIEGVDVQMLADGTIDVNICTKDASAYAPNSDIQSEPGLRGWQPQSKDQSYEYVKQLDSEIKSKGRSVIERLESMEKMQAAMVELWEKMKVREALSLGKQKSDAEPAKDAVRALQQLSALPLTNAAATSSSRPSPHAHANEPAVPAIQPELRDRSRSVFSSIESLSTRNDSIDIRISDPPPLSSTSVSTLVDAAGGSKPDSTDASPPVVSTRDNVFTLDKSGTEDPVVRIYATGNAEVQLLELAKRLIGEENAPKERSGKDEMAQCIEGDVQDAREKGPEAVAMDIDVFNSRPNLLLDPRRESTKGCHSAKTLVGDAIPNVDSTLSDVGSRATPSVSIEPLSESAHPPKDPLQSHNTPSTSTPAQANEGQPSLKIKIKPIRYQTMNESTSTRMRNAATSELSPRLSTLPSTAPIASTSTSHSHSRPLSKPASPTKVGFGTGKQFALSPVVDWTQNSPSSNRKHTQITTTPIRTARLLRSSSRSQARLDTQNSVPLRTPTRSPKKLSTPAQSREVKIEDVVHSQETEVSSTVKLAERTIQGLLDVQALSPQKSFSLDSTAAAGLTTPTASGNSSLVIRISSSSTRSSNVFPPPMAPPRIMPKEEEVDDGPAKRIAKRALKGLLHSQATSPPKSYSVDLNIASLAQKSTIALIDPPTSMPNRPDTPTTSPLLSKSYTLPTPLEGTVAALRQQTLGHPYVYAGARIGSSRTETREAKLEELETIGMQQDNEMQVQTWDDITLISEEAYSGRKEKSAVEATAIHIDEPMEDSMIQETRPANEVHGGGDNFMEDTPSKQVSMDVQAASDIQEIMPSTPTPPLPALEVLRKSVEPLQEFEALPSGSMPLAEPTISHSPTPPFSSVSQSEPQLSPQPELQPSILSSTTTSPPSPSPSFKVTARLIPNDAAPSVSHPDSETQTEPENVIVLPSAPSVPVLPIDNVVPLPMSQATTTTVDEQQVDRLLMNDVVSSPVKVSVLELDDQESLNNFESDGAFFAIEGTTLRCSPDILTLPNSRPHVLDDILNDFGTATVRVEPDQAGEAVIEPPSALFADDMQDQLVPPQDDEVNQGTESHNTWIPSLVPPHVPSDDQPTSAGDEHLLRSETILQSKMELDALQGEHISMDRQTTPAGKGKKTVAGDAVAELEYIYISDSTPQKRPAKEAFAANQQQKKRLQRASSVISISSDDDDDDDEGKVNLLWSKEQSDNKKSSEIDALKIGRFSEPIETSTPVRSRIIVEVDAKEQFAIKRAPVIAAAQELVHTEAPSAASWFERELSPMSELSEPTPSPHNAHQEGPERDGTARVEAEEGAKNIRNISFNFKKYSAKLDADDDVPIIPLRKKRKVSGISEVPTEDGSVADSETGTVVPKKKSLLVLTKKGRSAAITRVKKRKTPHQGLGSDNEDQPPLKKANLRKDIKIGETKGNKQEILPKAKEKGKTQEQPARGQPARSPAKKMKAEVPRTPTRFPRGQQKARAVQWPTIQKPNFDQFIRCDVCDCWYHLGCVGIAPDHPSMDDAELYTCPPCEAGVSVNDSESPHKVQHSFDNPQTNSCSRPKCQRPKKTKKKDLPEEETFVVESFVGRHRRVVGGKGTIVYYLVKWHGYSYGECTWEELYAMGLANSSILEITFENAARDEDIDLENSTNEYLLLQEAVEAGWRPDGCFIRPE